MTAPTVHPVWCDLEVCSVEGESGEHRSTRLTTAGLAEVQVWLEAIPEDATGAVAPVGTFLLVQLVQEGAAGVYLFALAQAATVAGHMRALVDQATEVGR